MRHLSGGTSERGSAWHALGIEEAWRSLGSRPEGLTASEVDSQARTHGPNRLARGRRESPAKILLRQLASPLVYVLLAAAALAVIMGKVSDGAVVLAVVAINTLVGFVQELRAGKAITAGENCRWATPREQRLLQRSRQ